MASYTFSASKQCLRHLFCSSHLQINAIKSVTGLGIWLYNRMAGDITYQRMYIAGNVLYCFCSMSRRARRALAVTFQAQRCRKRANFGCSRFGCSLSPTSLDIVSKSDLHILCT